MSTLTYAVLTTKRKDEISAVKISALPRFIDTISALAPVEALLIHAIVANATIERDAGSTWKISDTMALQWLWGVLIAFTVAGYVASRKLSSPVREASAETSRKDPLCAADFARCLIPGLALVAWLMLERPSAFDAVAAELDGTCRLIISLSTFGVLAVVATVLQPRPDENKIFDHAEQWTALGP